MKIAFFGLKKTFDYYQIGGTDSIVRRLAIEICKLGDEVDFVHYRCPENKISDAPNGIKLKYFARIEQAYECLKNYDHVVSIYIDRKDRISFARFRRKNCRNVIFHHIYTVWPESFIKRSLICSETYTFPFNGKTFCISPRIYKSISRWSPRASLMLPPVGQGFFNKPEEKKTTAKLKIAFIGRVDPGKGTERVIELFKSLDAEKYECRINGFAWPHKKDTLKLHQALLRQKRIEYKHTNFSGWSEQAETGLCDYLLDSDIVILPYKRLSSTIDVPLLLLEAMASLCCVITPPLGDIPQIYGKSKFTMNNRWNNSTAKTMIESASNYLKQERQRLFEQNKTLGFDSKTIASLFKNNLIETQKSAANS